MLAQLLTLPELSKKKAAVKSPAFFFFLPRMNRPNPTPTAQDTLEELLSAVAEPLNFEVVSAEWTGSGKYRVLRIFIDALLEPAKAEESETPGQESPSPEPESPAPVVSRSSVTLQDCARLSRLFDLRLDAAESEAEFSGLAGQLKAPYTLEVSSPGIERPLTKQAHFERFAGHPVSIRCHQAILADSERKTFNGTLLGVRAETDSAPQVRMHEKDLDQEVEIPLASIRKAHLVFEGRI